MTFLQTIFLPALAGAAIPLLLHFLSRRRLPLIPFSSLEFLQRLQKRASRRVQLRQIILLALRTLAVLALVMVFARPAVESVGAVGAASTVEMVILLDDGLTSAAQTRDGELLELSRVRIEAILDLAGPGDQVTILPLATPQRRLAAGYGGMRLLMEDLAQMEPRFVRPALAPALKIADSILAASSRSNRELVIVSGFYEVGAETLTTVRPAGVRTLLIPVGPERLSNLSITGFKRRSTILQAGRPVDIEVQIANYTGQDVEGAVLSLYLEGERVAQGSLEMPDKASVSKVLTFTPPRSGNLAGSIRIEENDALAADNRYYFTLAVPEVVRLVAVCPDTITRVILRAALATEAAGFVHLDFAAHDRWETMSLANCDVLLLAGVKDVSTGAAARVVEFVQSGGGLVMAPSKESDLTGLSRGLWKQLGFAGAKGIVSGSGITWGRVDLEHPIFSGMFEAGGAPRSPSLRLAVDMAVGEGDQVAIPLSSGSPFLMERTPGRGRALLLTSPLTPEVGDWIYSGIFAPLLFRAVIYASAGSSSEGEDWRTGEVRRPLLQMERPTEATLVDPEGESRALPMRPTATGVEFDTGLIELPGIYDVKVSSATLGRFAANLPSGSPAYMRPAPGDMAKRYAGAQILPDDPMSIPTAVRESRFGRELWQTAAALFLGFLLSESLLARPRRSGPEP
ncbi:MAG: hypothetical protein FJY67_04935 [Calditrichaeota bacterium]|nr:hypothetical protein [Calditrichota bacterium]